MTFELQKYLLKSFSDKRLFQPPKKAHLNPILELIG